MGFPFEAPPKKMFGFISQNTLRHSSLWHKKQQFLEDHPGKEDLDLVE
jgi:hypothetical protein